MPAVSPAVAAFVKNYYIAADTPSDAQTDEAYRARFFPDATMLMGPHTFKGYEGVDAHRRGLWDSHSKSVHVVDGIFPSPTDENDVMNHGSVVLTGKDGAVRNVEFAGHFVLRPDDKGELRIHTYQVYMTPR